MKLEQLTTLDAISQFLEGTQAVAFSVAIISKQRALPLGTEDAGKAPVHATWQVR